MRRTLLSSMVVLMGMMAGCTGPTSSAPSVGSSGGGEMSPATSNDSASSGEASPMASLTPVGIENGAIALSPAYTMIEFVGTHAGNKPDPRVGHFGQFSGTLLVDPATKALAGVSIKIDAASLKTEFDKLTDHLKSPDFLEVAAYPEISFQSTSIQPGEGGLVDIVGDLTLHGETKSVTFPATIAFTENGLTLDSKAKIDRTEFKMEFGVDRVLKDVGIRVLVGKPTP
jgi:polyisoprenoid-binding protein YceI